MDGQSTEEITVEVDLVGGATFEEARARFRGDDQARAHAAVDAATALLALADADAAADLAHYLCADPADTIASYTVVCYEFGDVIPSSVRDFSDPIAALAALRDLDDPDLAAAELTTVTLTGLRWIPVVRSGERIVFQVPDSESASSETLSDDEVEQALLRWYRAAGLPMSSSTVTQQVVDLTDRATASLTTAAPAVATRLDIVDERLHSLAGNITLLSERLTTLLERSDPSVSLERRLAAIERRLDQAVHDVIGEVAATAHQQSEYATEFRAAIEAADARQRERLEATARWLSTSLSADLQQVITQTAALRDGADVAGEGAAELQAGIDRLTDMLGQLASRQPEEATPPGEAEQLAEIRDALRELAEAQVASALPSQRAQRTAAMQHILRDRPPAPGLDDV